MWCGRRRRRRGRGRAGGRAVVGFQRTAGFGGWIKISGRRRSGARPKTSFFRRARKRDGGQRALGRMRLGSIAGGLIIQLANGVLWSQEAGERQVGLAVTAQDSFTN